MKLVLKSSKGEFYLHVINNELDNVFIAVLSKDDILSLELALRNSPVENLINLENEDIINVENKEEDLLFVQIKVKVLEKVFLATVDHGIINKEIAEKHYRFAYLLNTEIKVIVELLGIENLNISEEHFWELLLWNGWKKVKF